MVLTKTLNLATQKFYLLLHYNSLLGMYLSVY